jgi:gamma-glutamylaminecyclotransferase
MAMLFVFGTLKRGFPLHPALDGAQFFGRASTVDRWPMCIAGKWFAPMMLPLAGQGERVEGELYVVSDGQLAAIDKIESVGKPGNLRCVIEVVREENGIKAGALAYMKSPELAVPRHSDFLSKYEDTRFVSQWDRPQ